MEVIYWVVFVVITLIAMILGTIHRLGGFLGVKLSKKWRFVGFIAGIIALILFLFQISFDF